MNAYDGVMAVLVLIGLIWGSMRGFTSQLATVASLTLGYLFAYPLAGPISTKIPIEPPASWYLALILGYIAIAALVFFAAGIVRMILRRWKMEDFDKHLGMMAGGVGAFAVGLVLTVVVTAVMPSLKMTVAQSPTGKFAGRVFSAVAPALPKEFRDSDPFAEGATQDVGVGVNADEDEPPRSRSARATIEGEDAETPIPPPSRKPTASANASSKPTANANANPKLNRDELLRRAANKALDQILGDPDAVPPPSRPSQPEPESNPYAAPRRR